MDLYAETILDHYRHPRGKTALAEHSVSHHEINTSCGDELTLMLRIENDRITALGWTGEGCAISQAGMSMLSEQLQGSTVSEAAAISTQDMMELLVVPIGPRRFKCALLGLHTLKNALRSAQGLPPQEWAETVGNP